MPNKKSNLKKVSLKPKIWRKDKWGDGSSTDDNRKRQVEIAKSLNSIIDYLEGNYVKELIKKNNIIKEVTRAELIDLED